MLRRQLPIPDPVSKDAAAFELLRIWITSDRNLAVSVDVESVDGPAFYGLAISDVVNQFCDMDERPPDFKDQLLANLNILLKEIVDGQ